MRGPAPATRAAHTKRTPIRAASPILKAIFEDMNGRGVRLADMGDMIGRHEARVSEWRRGLVEPGIMVVDEMADVLGYRLVLEKKDSSR